MLWYSLEAPHQEASNEYPQHMFSLINKKNIMWIPPLIYSYVSNKVKVSHDLGAIWLLRVGLQQRKGRTQSFPFLAFNLPLNDTHSLLIAISFIR